jgi:hypothetical protein
VWVSKPLEEARPAGIAGAGGWEPEGPAERAERSLLLYARIKAGARRDYGGLWAKAADPARFRFVTMRYR